MTPPTAREHQLLQYLRSYYGERGIMPTYPEMMAFMGVRSKSGIHRMIDGLIKRGHVTRMPASARGLRLKGSDVSTAEAICAVIDRCRLSEHALAELRGLLAGAAQ
jgi:SOS-response transcriptional repressor LexA